MDNKNSQFLLFFILTIGKFDYEKYIDTIYYINKKGFYMKEIIKEEVKDIFNYVLKESNLTMKVLLGTKRDQYLLFGRYNDNSITMIDYTYEIEILRKNLDKKESLFKIFKECDQPKGEFDICVYKTSDISKYKIFENNEKIFFNVKILNNNLILNNLICK